MAGGTSHGRQVREICIGVLVQDDSAIRVHRHRQPQVSDQGREFVNQVCKNIYYVYLYVQNSIHIGEQRAIYPQGF